MLIWVVIFALLGCGSAFRCGFGRPFPSFAKRSAFGPFAVPTDHSFSSETTETLTSCRAFDIARIITLVGSRVTVNRTVLPAFETSPFLLAKYPDPLNRTVQNILGGLPDVVDIEYLNSLPVNDPRRHLLATIPDPGTERRAELIENLQAIDAERGKVAQTESTYSVYQNLSYKAIDNDLFNTFMTAAADETLRRRRPEFTEYGTPEWFGDFFGSPELLQFIETCFERSDGSLVCKHPCLSVFFPYYNASEPQSTRASNTFAELDQMSEAFNLIRAMSHQLLDRVVYNIIEKSPIIAEKYPHPADRTPHKLLGGLANTVSIEYMQSLEPHDPRRLFLDTLKAPDEQRCAELERNALLVDEAVMEALQQQNIFEFVPIRIILLNILSIGQEANYLSALKSAKLSKQVRRYAKNNGGKGADPEGDAYREKLAAFR